MILQLLPWGSKKNTKVSVLLIEIEECNSNNSLCFPAHRLEVLPVPLRIWSTARYTSQSWNSNFCWAFFHLASDVCCACVAGQEMFELRGPLSCLASPPPPHGS